MTKRILLALLVALVPWRDIWIDAAELRIAKTERGLLLTSPDAADLGVVPLGGNRFAIIVAVGNPPRVEILYFGEIPNPGPMPTVPEATRLAGEWLAVVPDASRARAPDLAEAFESVATRIDDGELKDVAAIIAASTAANREALGESRNDWLPWFEKLRDYMNGLADEGRLKTAADHARLFRELAEGLRR